jgi:hypothetical protein
MTRSWRGTLVRIAADPTLTSSEKALIVVAILGFLLAMSLPFVAYRLKHRDRKIYPKGATFPTPSWYVKADDRPQAGSTAPLSVEKLAGMIAIICISAALAGLLSLDPINARGAAPAGASHAENLPGGSSPRASASPSSPGFSLGAAQPTLAESVQDFITDYNQAEKSGRAQSTFDQYWLFPAYFYGKKEVSAQTLLQLLHTIRAKRPASEKMCDLSGARVLDPSGDRDLSVPDIGSQVSVTTAQLWVNTANGDRGTMTLDYILERSSTGLPWRIRSMNNAEGVEQRDACS